jgi:hypothetical protein
MSDDQQHLKSITDFIKDFFIFQNDKEKSDMNYKSLFRISLLDSLLHKFIFQHRSKEDYLSYLLTLFKENYENIENADPTYLYLRECFAYYMKTEPKNNLLTYHWK